LCSFLKHRLGELHPDAVVRIQLRGPVSPAVRSVVSAPNLRAMAPETMNVTLTVPSARQGFRRGRRQ
jgi:hypothetical protein